MVKRPFHHSKLIDTVSGLGRRVLVVPFGLARACGTFRQTCSLISVHTAAHLSHCSAQTHTSYPYRPRRVCAAKMVGGREHGTARIP